METVWKRVKSDIKQRVPSHSFNMWIEPLKVTEIGENGWIFSCPNFFSKKRVEGLYGAMIKKALQHALGRARGAAPGLGTGVPASGGGTTA